MVTPASYPATDSAYNHRRIDGRKRQRPVNLGLHAVTRDRHLANVLRLIRLTLTEFRSYAALTWRPSARISVLYGPNGSGKTNLLEAVSLLVPGRGLRGARAIDLPRQPGIGHGGGPALGYDNGNGQQDQASSGGDNGRFGVRAWGVAGRFQTPEGEVDIGTGTPPGATPPGADGPSDRRVFRLDGAAPRNQGEIARRVAVVWLTPQMDRLFLEGLAGRRRFLDRLVWALEPGHAREMASHDTAVGSRNRLLAEGRRDRSWLAGLEDAIARHAVAAAAARLDLANRLNAQAGVTGRFPAAHMRLLCPIAERLTYEPALTVEDWLRAGLEASRARDEAAGTTALGAHRTDMLLTDLATGTTASLASTGQQKALLVGVVLSHARLIAASRGFAPLLLLDEPAIHLDPDRRAALFDVLAESPAQTLITGTDAETFLPLMDRAEAFATGDGKLRPDGRFLLPEIPVVSIPTRRRD
jgi:DNA replication and repair protein RecF